MADELEQSPTREAVARFNATLQIGYLLMAIRARGLAACPMMGFDHDAAAAEFFPGGREAVLLARLIRDSKAQPVTTRPELSEARVGAQRIPIVSIGTGSYLGLTDAADKSIQTISSVPTFFIGERAVEAQIQKTCQGRVL